jgi:hypothetical protein
MPSACKEAAARCDFTTDESDVHEHVPVSNRAMLIGRPLKQPILARISGDRRLARAMLQCVAICQISGHDTYKAGLIGV